MMTLVGFLILVLIAAICGSIGQAIAGFSRGGCLAATVVGFIGALLGMWLGQQLGLPQYFTITIEGQPFPVLWAIIGSALFSAFLALLSNRRSLI
jgi:uncharacterized membrane protein YeaQ/YmgE (transglycosylase-associated protein family)